MKAGIKISIHGDDDSEAPVTNHLVTGLVTQALRNGGFDNISLDDHLPQLSSRDPATKHYDTPEAYLKTKGGDTPTLLDVVSRTRSSLLSTPIALDVYDGPTRAKEEAHAHEVIERVHRKMEEDRLNDPVGTAAEEALSEALEESASLVAVAFAGIAEALTETVTKAVTKALKEKK